MLGWLALLLLNRVEKQPQYIPDVFICRIEGALNYISTCGIFRHTATGYV